MRDDDLEVAHEVEVDLGLRVGSTELRKIRPGPCNIALGSDRGP